LRVRIPIVQTAFLDPGLPKGMADANLAPCNTGLPGFASSGANSRIDFTGVTARRPVPTYEFAFANLRAGNEVQAICPLTPASLECFVHNQGSKSQIFFGAIFIEGHRI